MSDNFPSATGVYIVHFFPATVGVHHSILHNTYPCLTVSSYIFDSVPSQQSILTMKKDSDTHISLFNLTYMKLTG